jgi:two-component system chemotaxis response regulator CheY
VAGLDLSALRVLAIDDNGFSRRLVTAALRSLNVHQVAEAENAVDGFSIMRAFQPDMILVDWVMPEVDGVAFAKQVRGDKTGNFRFLPIIMTTSYSEIWRVQQARDVGINEFVVKPFSARTLYTKIKTIVDNPRPYIDISDGYFGPDRRRRTSAVREERRGQKKAPAPSA